ncbi:branched-chain amino acid ABC transporter substrate-binding protein [Melaminivora suipulveris]|uniref:Branched-chain amino acid ABC transporter substrate-binding protein n=1 Tax=Melaminivora suipulveris TaxID=2109913 RepID=A0A2R3QA59_9BURK|nr:substrate-binding protein [Melaminivora suipulveris]AVO48527.1 branched-chain amino acid ABC transporter substrate-binding protein [Melaminivora suipulveris]
MPEINNTEGSLHLSRRNVLQAGAVLLGNFGGLQVVYAADEPALGATWPAGSKGDTVYLGASVPLTGTYGLQGADELKGMELAVEHINTNHELMKKIAPKINNGVLGKKVGLVSGDSAAKPNQALQLQENFINQNKVVLMIGSTASSVAVAMNKFAQREKVIYMAGISGSNETTGDQCTRYAFRQGFYSDMVVKAIGPYLLRQFGKNRKFAALTPDYNYGHTTTKAFDDYMKAHGWKMVTNQVSPLGTQDFSQYLTNIANSGAEFICNSNWGRDAVLSAQQAKQFGLIPKMTLLMPYQVPFFAPEAGVDISAGVITGTEFYWGLEDKYPMAKMYVDAFMKKYGYRPEWGSENGYMSFAHWARMVTDAGTFYPPTVIKQFEKGEKIPSLLGDVHYRPEDHQCIRPIAVVRGKAKKDMKNKEDFWEVVEVAAADQIAMPLSAYNCKLASYT